MSAEEEKIAQEMQVDLLAGTLEFDPENDPVLGTTESGIEIKYHNATTTLTGNWDYTAFTKNYFLGNSIASGTFHNLSGYLYITMAGYNWVIIGRNSNLTTISLTNTYAQASAKPTEFIKFASYSTYASALNNQTETTTDAGSAINSANSKGLVNTITGVTRNYSYSLSSYGAPVAANEIPSGCVLCLCATAITKSYFNNYNVGNNYNDSILQTTINNLYSSGLGLTSSQKAQIQSVTLKTQYYSGTSSVSAYMFPLAGADASESYYISTYLTTDAKRDLDASTELWVLRSGSVSNKNSIYAVSSDGKVGSAYRTYADWNVRPAFVLKL